MTKRRSHTPSRASALALALLAITFNFMQPLAHAAAMRAGSPKALWATICEAAAAHPDGKSSGAPAKNDIHECCLGLAHAPAMAVPSAAFILVEVPRASGPISLPTPWPVVSGIRDGPPHLRGPPSVA